MKRWTLASGLLIFAASAASAQLLSTGFDTGIVDPVAMGQLPAPHTSPTSISFETRHETDANGLIPNTGIDGVRSVPSPGSAALLGLGALICLRRRHTT